jgi:hypothetical protein
LSKKGIDGRLVKPGKFLQLVHTRAPLALLDCDKGGARNVNCRRGVSLRYLCFFASEAQTLADLRRGRLFDGLIH